VCSRQDCPAAADLVVFTTSKKTGRFEMFPVCYGHFEDMLETFTANGSGPVRAYGISTARQAAEKVVLRH